MRKAEEHRETPAGRVQYQSLENPDQYLRQQKMCNNIIAIIGAKVHWERRVQLVPQCFAFIHPVRVGNKYFLKLALVVELGGFTVSTLFLCRAELGSQL